MFSTDKDGDNSISAEDLQQSLASLGETGVDCRELLLEASAGQPTISFDRFASLIREKIVEIKRSRTDLINALKAFDHGGEV